MSSTKKTPEHSRRAYDLLAMAAATVTAAAAATVTAAAAAEAAAVTATAPTVTAATVTATAVEAARAVAEAVVAVVAAWGFGGEVAAAVAGVQAATGAGGTASESGAIIEHNKCRAPTAYDALLIPWLRPSWSQCDEASAEPRGRARAFGMLLVHVAVRFRLSKALAIDPL
jgi:hypothetical protein